ncbi:MAG: hypothetical protein RL026_2056 [Pseudomonadota bacterium]
MDDSALSRAAVRRALAPLPVEVAEAADGAAALEVLRAAAADLVLLDYNMPVMDGAQMLAALRADATLARTRVLLLTANATPEVLATAARLGVRDYLVKPFDDAALRAKVARQLGLPREETTT